MGGPPRRPKPSDRLALLIADLEGGGAQRTMVTLANAFAGRGHLVDLLAVRAVGPLRDKLAAGVRLLPLDGWPTRLPLVATHKRRRLLASAPLLAAYLRRERPRTLMSTSHSVNVAACLAVSLSRSATRLVLRIDSQLSRAPELEGTRRQRRRLRRARRHFPRADAVIAISRGVGADLAARTRIEPRRIHAIHNPVVTPELADRASKPTRQAWLSDPGPPVVLAVGRLVEQKDYPTLLRAFARVRAVREARLLILGEGRERARLEALIRELDIAADVSLPGFDPNPPAAMSRARVLALSSAWEGFGNVLVEALFCGCPVVSTDCPSGPAEILEGGRHGALTPVGDDAALARAILDTLEQPPAAEALRARARSFCVDRVADRYLEVLLAG